MAAQPVRYKPVYPRGKVTRVQELCLQIHSEYLKEELECREIVDNLRTHFILNVNDEEFIMGREGSRYTRQEQNRRLVDTITRRSSRGFEAFLQALQDTGHDAAHRKLTNTLDNREESEEDEVFEDPLPQLGEKPRPLGSSGDDVTLILERVDDLSDSIEGIKLHMEVLSRRLTHMDGGRQTEMERLKEELNDARSEIDHLRTENEELSARVSDRSEQLEHARKKIAEMEEKVSEMEIENENMLKKFKEQSKRLENMQARNKQAYTKLNTLEQNLELQKQEHKKELEEQKQQHKKDAEQTKRRLDREFDKRRTLEDKVNKLEDKRRSSDAALRYMEERFSQLEKNMKELKKSSEPEVTQRSPRRHVGE